MFTWSRFNNTGGVLFGYVDTYMQHTKQHIVVSTCETELYF